MIIQTWDALVPNGKVSQYNIESPYQTDMKTDTAFEQGGVSGEKIDTIQWNQGYGGKLTLGGKNNQNGLFQLRDSANDLIIQQDNLGSHYYDLAGNNIITVDAVGFHGYDTAIPHHEILRVDSGGLHTYDTSGNKLSEFTSGGAFFYSRNAIYFKNTPASGTAGLLGVDSGNNFYVAQNTGTANLELLATQDIRTTPGRDVILNASRNINLSPLGQINMYGRKVFFSASASDYEFGVSGGQPTLLFDGNLKTAIVPTPKDGFRALYTNESPEVWFMDFAKIKRKPWWKFWGKNDIMLDRLFMEVTSPPYITIPTMDRNIVQVWAKRKGFEKVRFEKKTETEARINNEFWGAAHNTASKIDNMRKTN